MKIILNDNYYIKDEQIGYSLNKTYVSYGKGKNKDDSPRLIDKTVGFYMKVEDCAERFAYELAHDQTDFEGNLDELISRLKNVFDSAISKIKKAVK